MLQVTIEKSGNTVILHCAGRIVRGSETAILCPAVGQPGRSVILELSQVDAIDAAGVGALITLQAAGVYVQLMNPSRAVCEVLRITRLDRIFDIGSSLRTESLEDGSRPQPSVELPLSPVVAAAG